MTPEERAKAEWNSGADRWNQWDDLGQDERDELIVAQKDPAP